MSQIIITVEGADELMRKSKKFIPAVNAALLAGGKEVIGKAKEYPAKNRPTRASVYGKTFVSDRQRRWFFAVGIHQTPYRRSKTLGQAWTTEPRGQFKVVIGNNTIYGPYVQSPQKQSLYHQAVGWKNTDQIANENAPLVVNKIKQAIDKL